MGIEAILRREIEKVGSQYRVAKESGVQQSAINRFMTGQRGLSLQHAETLLRYFGYVVKRGGGRRAQR